MQPEQPIQPAYSPAPIQQVNGGVNKRKRLLIFAVGIFVGLTVILIAASVIFGGNQSLNDVSLSTVRARNSGILNLLDEFGSEVRTSEGTSYVSRAKILITSDSLLIADYAPSPSKQQVSDLNFKAITGELEEAIALGNFDEFFISTIDYEIAANKSLLENLDPSEVGSNLESIVTTAIANYDSLLN